MKATLATLFVLITIFGYSQTSPEDIIMVYDELNPNGKMILKSELVTNLDSLSLFLKDETEEKLLVQQDSSTIRNALIGKWTLESVERVNGIPFNLVSYQNLQFRESGEFSFERSNEKVQGTWTVRNKRKGTLLFNYYEPQLAIIDKEIIAQLPKEQIQALTFSSETRMIKAIDKDTLVFMTFIAGNPENIDDMFCRLILTTYKRIE